MKLEKLTKDEIDKRLAELQDWIHQSPETPQATDMLFKMYPFEEFKKARNFASKIAEIAEKLEQYPTITFYTNYVNVILWSPDINGLTEKDFELAEEIDKLDQPAITKDKYSEEQK